MQAEQGPRAGPGPAAATLPPTHGNGVAQAAVLACLGSAEAHAEVLRALASPKDEDVELAQVYLRHRPIADSTELRGVATSIVSMGGSAAQVRALDTLAGYQLSDRETLGALAQLFSLTKSVERAACYRRRPDSVRLSRDRGSGAGAVIARASAEISRRRRSDRRSHPPHGGFLPGAVQVVVAVARFDDCRWAEISSSRGDAAGGVVRLARRAYGARSWHPQSKKYAGLRRLQYGPDPICRASAPDHAA